MFGWYRFANWYQERYQTRVDYMEHQRLVLAIRSDDGVWYQIVRTTWDHAVFEIVEYHDDGTISAKQGTLEECMRLLPLLIWGEK